MKIAFLGTPELAASCLQALLEQAAERHPVVCAVTNPDRPVGRRGDPQPPPVKVTAQAAGVPVVQPVNVRTRRFRSELVATGAEIGVTVAYGKILGPRLLTSLPHGFLNAHVSLLPRWRGASPIQAALLAGDARTGVSVMQMDAGLDTGDILRSEDLPVGARETAPELQDRLVPLAVRLLLESLDAIARGEHDPMPQDDSEHGPPTTCGIITKGEGRIDWGATAVRIDRQVRAFNPWPGTYTELGGQRVLVRAGAPALEAEAAAAGGEAGRLCAVGERLLVACGQGVFEVTEVQRGGRKSCSAAEFLRGAHLTGTEKFE